MPTEPKQNNVEHNDGTLPKKSIMMKDGRAPASNLGDTPYHSALACVPLLLHYLYGFQQQLISAY
jgi:hypothetical protein